MIYHGYEIEPSYLTEMSGKETISWRVTGSGTYVVGRKSGQRYMIKRYITIRYPDPSLPKDTYDLYLEEFRAIRKKQDAIKNAFKSYDWKRDHIVAEVDNFNDEENMYVVVTPWLTDKVPDDYKFKDISWNVFLKMAQKMCEILRKTHAVGVVHSDLKIENFCFVPAGTDLDPYLVDFDLSFMKANPPTADTIGGSPGYQAPEVLEYIYGGDSSKGKELISEAIDVFSLAITMHGLWTDEFPDCDDESVGDGLLNGVPFTVNSKFDREIGPANHVTFKALLEAMMTREPNKRLTMEQVVEIINDRANIGPVAPKFEEPWPDDGIAWVESLPAGNRIKDIKRAAGNHYKVFKDNGMVSFVDAAKLVAMGLATYVDGAPRKRDEEEDKPRESKVVCDDGPWPEDAAGGYSYNKEALDAKGVLSIKKDDSDGSHKYCLVYADRTTTMPGGMLKVIKVIAK